MCELIDYICQLWIEHLMFVPTVGQYTTSLSLSYLLRVVLTRFRLLSHSFLTVCTGNPSTLFLYLLLTHLTTQILCQRTINCLLYIICKKKELNYAPFLWDGIFNVHHERERKMFYLTTHSTHFIYGYMASDKWLRTILIVRKETRCRHIGYSYQLTARVLLYAPSHRQDNTYHGLCYTSRGALAGTRNSSMGPPHEGSIRRPIAPWANALPLSYVPLLYITRP